MSVGSTMGSLGPPSSEIPGALSIAPMTIRSKCAVISVMDVNVYSAGISFSTRLWRRYPGSDFKADLTLRSWSMSGHEGIVAGDFYLEVTLSDGRLASNEQTSAGRYSISPVSASINGNNCRLSWWISPRPTDLVLRIGWPGWGVPIQAIVSQLLLHHVNKILSRLARRMSRREFRQCSTPVPTSATWASCSVTASSETTMTYTRVSVQKLREVHAATHPAERPRSDLSPSASDRGG